MNITCLIVAAIELLSPAQESTVRLLPDCQIAVLTNATRTQRLAVLAAQHKDYKKRGKTEHWRESVPLVLQWRVTDHEKGPWQIDIARTPDFANARTWMTSKPTVDAKDKHVFSYDVPCVNLEIATKYYWRVRSNITCGRWGHRRICECKDRTPERVSATGCFTTEDLAPRWITIEGSSARTVRNFRDLGGRIGREGRRVRQGMIYRSQGLNDNSIDGCVPGKSRLSVEDVKYLTTTLGIKTDLDLRSEGETAGMKNSPLFVGILAQVRFVNRSSKCYDGIFTPEGKKIMAENFRLFCDRANYPILFHCIAGADRTGALGYVLNGVLGVTRSEIETDWESTFYPHVPMYDKPKGKDKGKDVEKKLAWNSELHFDNGFGAYGTPEDSWNDRVVLYLKDCGITDAEIETFRGIMLQ